VRGKDRKYVWAAWPDKGGGNVPQALRQKAAKKLIAAVK
jgi:hypothetical protein